MDTKQLVTTQIEVLSKSLAYLDRLGDYIKEELSKKVEERDEYDWEETFGKGVSIAKAAVDVTGSIIRTISAQQKAMKMLSELSEIETDNTPELTRPKDENIEQKPSETSVNEPTATPLPLEKPDSSCSDKKSEVVTSAPSSTDWIRVRSFT
jgi:hypothetical protein